MRWQPLAAPFLLALLLSLPSACSSNGSPSDAPTDSGADALFAPVAPDAPPSDASLSDAADADALSPACVAQQAALQKALDTARVSATTPGAILAVTTPGCGRWVGASGTSTKSVPLAPTDVFRVGSVTKTFVATAVLQLVTQGKVALTDSLDKWLPGFPNGAQITLKEVMNHTSGIYDYTDDPTWQMTIATDPGTVWTPAQLVAIAASHAPYFAPGQGWTYSNTDYILLGQLLEKVTGQPAGAVLHRLAIDEAGLKLTTLPGYEPIQGTLAHGFATNGQDVSTLFDPSYAWTAGAIVSSGGDLADWAVALYGGSVLSPSALAMMVDGVPTGEEGLEYGLGVMIFSPAVTGGPMAWGHDGDINGYHCQLTYFPSKKIAIVAMVNSDGGDPNAISLAAFDVLKL